MDRRGSFYRLAIASRESARRVVYPARHRDAEQMAPCGGPASHLHSSVLSTCSCLHQRSRWRCRPIDCTGAPTCSTSVGKHAPIAQLRNELRNELCASVIPNKFIAAHALCQNHPVRRYSNMRHAASVVPQAASAVSDDAAQTPQQGPPRRSLLVASSCALSACFLMDQSGSMNTAQWVQVSPAVLA